MPGRRLPTRRQVASSGGSTPALGQLSVTATGVATPDLIYSGVAGSPAFTPPDAFYVTNVGAGPWSGAPSLVVSYDDTEDWLSTTSSVGLDGAVTYEFSIDTSILAAGTQVATLTFTDALCSNSPQAATVAVVVEAQVPLLALSVGQFALNTLVGTATTVLSTTASNSGTGTLTAPTFGTIVYNEVFDDWITSPGVVDSGNGTYALSFTIDPTGGTAGTYGASIPIVSTGAANTPVVILVSLTLQPVASGGAVIALDRSLDDVSGTVGGNLPTQTVGISSANQFALAGPTIVGTTYSGDFADFATATINGSALAVALDVSDISVPGTAYATVEVEDANATLTATYQVFIKMDQVVQPSPSLIVLPTALGPSVVEGGIPTPATITINNANGSIAQLGTVSCTLTPGVAWASVAYNNGQAVVTYSTSALAAGSYATTLRIASTTATNSPRDIPIGLTVSAAPTPGLWPSPQVVQLPAGWTWDSAKGYPVGSCFNTLPSYRGADNGAMPAFSGTVHNVTSQAEWNTARTNLANGTIVDGDVIQIAAGLVLNNVQLPVRSGWTYGTSGFVQIRSGGHASLPAYSYDSGPDSYGTTNRVDRNVHLPYMATFRTTTTNQSTLLTQQGCGGYWITGIDFFADTTSWTYYNVNIHAHNGVNVTTQNQVAHCPSQIVLDRCVFRETHSALIKVRADGRHIAIRHCDIGVARMSTSTDSTTAEGKGIFLINTPGQFESLGNTYSAAGIGFLVGGADPQINNINPSDGMNMWNRIWSSPTANLAPDGDDYKNALEHKTGRRWFHAFNDVRYYPWHVDQNYIFLTKATDQGSGAGGNGSGNNFAAHTTDIAFWCNRVRNVAKGFYQSIDKSGEVSSQVIGTERIECCYNLHVYDESFVKPIRVPTGGANRRGASLYASYGDGIPNVRFEYNTFSGSGPSGAQSMWNIADTASVRTGWLNVVLNNNICHYQANYGPVFAGGTQGNNTQALNSVFLTGSWQFRRNYILQGGVGWDGGLLGGNNQNGYLASRNVFVDPANWNYTLVPSLTAASKDFPGGGGDTTGTADCGYNHAYLIAMLGDIGDGV